MSQWASKSMLISKSKWLRNCVSEHLMKEERRYSCGAMTETTAALNDLDKQKGPHSSASRPQRLDFYCFYRSSTTCRPVLLYCCCLFNVQRTVDCLTLVVSIRHQNAIIYADPSNLGKGSALQGGSLRVNWAALRRHRMTSGRGATRTNLCSSGEW